MNTTTGTQGCEPTANGAFFGQLYEITPTPSEVICHMRCDGRRMLAALCGRPDYPCVQLYNPDGSEFSAPVLASEAGVLRDHLGCWYWQAYAEARIVGAMLTA